MKTDDTIHRDTHTTTEGETVSGPHIIGRRTFLGATLGTATVLASGLSDSLLASPTKPVILAAPVPRKRPARLPQQALGPDLVEPVEIASSNGVLRSTLWIQPQTKEIVVAYMDGANTRFVSEERLLRMYGYDHPQTGQRMWSAPGPTFRAQLGDRVELTVVNQIDPSVFFPSSNLVCNDFQTDPPTPVTDTFPECLHGDNTTNVHYHGFHVSPDEPQDWIYLKLQPEGTTREDPDDRIGSFTFRIDAFGPQQAPGTHWYHPHKHGSTALQVVNGMAGAFIIEGPFDAYLRGHIPGLNERLFVIQQINDRVMPPTKGDKGRGPHNPTGQLNSAGGLPKYVNGQINPTVRMRPGEIQRWRFLNATQHATAQIDLLFEDPGDESLIPEVRQIAQDGVPFATTNYEHDVNVLSHLDRDEAPGEIEFAEVALAPGNRADFLVKAPDAPVTIALRQMPRAQTLTADFVAAAPVPAAPPQLFTLVVEGDPVQPPVDFPEKLPELPGFLTDIEDREIVRQRTVVFSADRSGQPRGEPPQFYIGVPGNERQQFDPNVILFDNMVMHTAEEWIIENHDPGVNHPFHIHINPFQITEVFAPNPGDHPGSNTGDTAPRTMPKPRVWWDTIALPKALDANTPGYIKIRQRYLDFTGEFVIHCHILGHEDRGMMQNIRVVSMAALTSRGG